MTSRKEMIELRKKIQSVIEDGQAFPADVLAAQIVLVFEQAHTPTDDEREALAIMSRMKDSAGRRQREEWCYVQYKDVLALGEALAAGFRRTVQGEPTWLNDEPFVTIIRELRRYLDGETEKIHFVRAVHEAVDWPQGELSDTQVVEEGESWISSFEGLTPIEVKNAPYHASRVISTLLAKIREGN